MTGTLRPQIITDIKSSVSFVTPAANKVAAMIAPAQWGPLNEVVTLSSIGDFINKFGGDKADGLIGFRGADLFFRNGGELKFVRIIDTNGEKASNELTRTAVNLIDVVAKYEGTYGNNIEITITVNGDNRNISITDGKRTELFSNAGAGYSSATDIITVVNARSELVTFALSEGGSGANMPDAQTIFLEDGDDGEDALATADYTTALNDVLYSENFQYLLAPGVTDEGYIDDLVAALNTRAVAERRFASLVTGIIKDETIATAGARLAASGDARLRIVAPNVIYRETVGNTDIILDGSFLACAVAGLFCRLRYSEAGTHKTVSVRDLSIDEATGRKYYNKTEQEKALQSGIIPVTLLGSSIQVVRDITSIGDDTDIKLSGTIVDIIDYVTNTLENYLETVIGLPNTSSYRSVWSSQCETILSQMKKDGIINSYEPVNIREGSSPNFIEVDVAVLPAFSVDFVYLNITI